MRVGGGRHDGRLQVKPAARDIAGGGEGEGEGNYRLAVP